MRHSQLNAVPAARLLERRRTQRHDELNHLGIGETLKDGLGDDNGVTARREVTLVHDAVQDCRAAPLVKID